MPTGLLKTKLYAPRSHPNLVSRPRLDEMLEEGMKRRLTLVSAPAGFGKTTLLADWSRRNGRPVAWLSLDEGDNDDKNFLSYLIAALETVEAGLGENLWSMLCTPQPTPPEAILTALLNEIPGDREDFILVLDDYHLIRENAVHEAVSFLIDHLPPPMHLFVAGRSAPPLPLPRWRGRGQLAELQAADLRFTPDEAATFLSEVMGLQLSAEDVAALEECTEGWISGLQLAAHAMRNREDQSGFIRSFTGSNRHILDYLAEEVFNCQPADVQEFLLRTSVLHRLTGPLCDALTGENDGRQMLERLEADNLFVVPLDDERRWYRYHHLFVDFLRERLRRTQPHAEPDLHRRASAWYESMGHQPEAADHALFAGDFDNAVRLIEESSGRMWQRGETALLLRWVEALPKELVRTRPSLCIFYAGALAHTGRLDDAEPWLRAAERSVETGETPEDSTVPDEAAVVRARIASMREDVPIIIKLSRKVLERLPEDDPFLREEIALNLGHAYCVTGDLEEADRTFAGAAAIGGDQGNMHVAMFAFWHQAMLKTALGCLREADEILRQALRIADSQDESTSPAIGIVYVGIGELLYERGDLDGAEHYLRSGIERGRRGGEAEILASGYENLARVLTARGEKEAALDLSEKAARMAQWPFMAARRARLLLANGDAEAAARWAEDYSLTEDYRSHPRDYERITVARVFMSQGKLEEALDLLDPLLETMKKNGMTGRVIEILTHQALVLQSLGEISEALSTLQRALALAEPEGYVRLFVDEGAPMAALLSRLLERNPAGRDGPSPAYVDRLISGILASVGRNGHGEQKNETLLEPLSERELEVLRLVADGLSNREIARTLFLSLGTVKAHISHVYGKLLVRNRTRAVARARELQLLD